MEESNSKKPQIIYPDRFKTYSIQIGELAELLYDFKNKKILKEDLDTSHWNINFIVLLNHIKNKIWICLKVAIFIPSQLSQRVKKQFTKCGIINKAGKYWIQQNI